MELNIAHVLRTIAAQQPESDCLCSERRQLSWAEFDDRTDRFAGALLGAGLLVDERRRNGLPPEISSPFARVGIYLHNGTEYLEAMMGAFKARAVGININYRYLAEELTFVLADSASEALVFHSRFAPLVSQILPQLPRLTVLFQVPDDSGHELVPGARWYEEALVEADPSVAIALDSSLSGNDHYCCYTGGTTGMPKGVIWRQEDFCEGALGINLRDETGQHSQDRLFNSLKPGRLRALPTPPFMHGAAHWNAISALLAGGAVCIQAVPERLDAADIWRTAEQFSATSLLMVGDAFAGPLLAELRRALERGEPYELGALRHILSGGATLSAVNAEALRQLLADVTIVDVLGSSESGRAAVSSRPPRSGAPATDSVASAPTSPVAPGAATTSPAAPGAAPASPAAQPAAAFAPEAHTTVLDATRSRVLSTGSHEIGWLALAGSVPLGYLGAPEKTAETFPVVDGVRYSVPGDRARWTSSGRIDLLGRDSACVNTGGEKVFVEEVESVLRAHRSVSDALVCGRPSSTWGSEVVAVVSLQSEDATSPTREPSPTPERSAMPAALLEEELITWCKAHLAHFKAPKAVLIRTEVARSASGKPDYAWARSQFQVENE